MPTQMCAKPVGVAVPSKCTKALKHVVDTKRSRRRKKAPRAANVVAIKYADLVGIAHPTVGAGRKGVKSMFGLRGSALASRWPAH
jgi:hypothetical protein